MVKPNSHSFFLVFLSELVILEESVHEHMNEKNSVQNAHHLGKPLESPSDRSLQKQ